MPGINRVNNFGLLYSPCNKAADIKKETENKNRYSEFSKNTSATKNNIAFKGADEIFKFRSAVKFFGLESPDDFTENEALFTEAKIRDTGCKTIKETVSPFDDYKNGNKNGYLAQIPLMLEKDGVCARVTTYDSYFGDSLHTIGFVRNNDNLYVLDSLGDESNETRMFHYCIREVISANAAKAGIKNIMFNQKEQQKEDLLTCNHWTFANIEAVKKALADGKEVKTREELDEILPKSIIPVLNAHYDYTKKLKY